MTALTTNGSAAAATTLAAAGKMFSATGGTSGNTSTKIAKTTQFVQVFAEGTTTAQTGVASIPAPTDSNFNGWMLDDTTLEGQRIAAGTWTPTFHMLSSVASTSVTPTVEWFKRSSSGVYTSIGSVTGSSVSLGTSSTALTFTPPSLALIDFATGDKLVMWLWVNVAAAGSSTTRTVSVVEATSGSTAGVASEAQAATPGYSQSPVSLSVSLAGIGALAGTLHTPVLILYGSAIADTTLTTACQMATASGGVETSKLTSWSSGASVYGEIFSQGTTTGVTSASIPATPTGNGWIYYPGAGTFATGNWSAVITGSGVGGATDATLRIFKYASGTYTLIGSIVNSWPIAKTANTFAATSMASFTTAAPDGVYFDLYFHDSTGAGGDNPTIYESTSATAGVASDMQVTTSAFTASSGVVLAVTLAGVGTLTASTPALSTALTSTLAGVGVLTPTLSASLTLPSVMMTGTGTLTPAYTYGQTAALYGHAYYAPTFYLSYATSLTTTLVGTGTLSGTLRTTGGPILIPRIFGGLITYTPITGAALTSTLSGAGTLSCTLAKSTTLAGALSGAGTLTGTLALTTPLTCTLPGIGTCTSTWTLATSLTSTEAGVGTCAGSLVASLQLNGATLAGVGTLSGTMAESTAVSGTMSGVGTLAGTISTAVSLTATMPGVGTLTGTVGLATSLTVTVPGRGVISGVLGTTAPVALSGTIVGIGTLSGSPVFTVFESGTLAGAGTLSLSGALQLATNLTASIPGIGHLTGALSANVTLPGVTLAGVGTIAGTISESTVLVASIPGVGTLAGTATFALQLATVTMAGVGTVAGVENLGTALTSTLAGVGTLAAAAPTFKTALAGQLSGQGQLSGILSGSGALVGTCAGAGTLVAPFTLATALSASANGAGTLSATLHEGTALAVTLVGSSQVSAQVQLQTALVASASGMGTVAFTLFLGTSLTVSLSGAGTLTTTGLSEGTNLALVFAALGSLSGHLIVPVLAYLSATCTTRDMQATARTRDMTATCVIRDMQATSKTRS